MDTRWRTAAVFAGSLLLGSLLALGAYRWWAAPPAAVGISSLPGRAMPGEANANASAAAEGSTPARPVVAPKACVFEPVVAPRGDADGRFALHAAVASQRGPDPAPFLRVADEAGVQGRARDAEVALIAACRVAAQESAASVAVADVQTRLSQHYAQLALRERDGAARTLLVQRADALLADGARAYDAVLGKDAPRTRLAAQRLEAFRQGSAALAAGQELPGGGGLPGTPLSDTTMLGASRQSLADRVPRTDEALAEVDADLERLYVQARNVSRDPAGLQRRHQQALAQRQACPDEACLRAWYAQRRRQLFAEF